ncbi:MAG: hypothetical protein GXO36_00360, partial [Chloroflexi bacterium]|nr:hypothetical protein [Chloroflexota bacterium]
MRRMWHYGLWLVLAGLAGLAARQVPWDHVQRALTEIPLRTWLGLIALNAFILWLFVLRWGWFLRQMGFTVPWHRLVAYRLAAFSVSYFTPGTQFGGE